MDEVYSSHALEHVYLSEAQTVLSEAYRVLKPGGIIRLALPDGEEIARELVAAIKDSDPSAGARFNARLLAFPESRPSIYAKLRNSFAGHVHRWQPTRSQVHQLLQDAGFESITERSFKEGDLPGVTEIETRPSSFFLEATKPGN